MTDPVPENFARLQAMHPAAVLLQEGGKSLALLPGLTFATAGRTETMDLLLVPFQHSGYFTRLFFEHQVPGRGANWTAHRVVDRNWCAPSWNDVPETMPWPAMLCAHLRAVT